MDVAVAEGVGVEVGVAVNVAVAVCVGVAEGVRVAEAAGVLVCFTAAWVDSVAVTIQTILVATGVWVKRGVDTGVLVFTCVDVTFGTLRVGDEAVGLVVDPESMVGPRVAVATGVNNSREN